jgi:hypothetical protein
MRLPPFPSCRQQPDGTRIATCLAEGDIAFLASISVTRAMAMRDSFRAVQRDDLSTDEQLLLGAPAPTERCAGEGELVFSFTHVKPMLPVGIRDVNWGVVPRLNKCGMNVRHTFISHLPNLI